MDKKLRETTNLFVEIMGSERQVQTLTTKDCKGPQTNMPKNVGFMKRPDQQK